MLNIESLDIICAPSIGEEQVAKFEKLFYAVRYIRLAVFTSFRLPISTFHDQNKTLFSNLATCSSPIEGAQIISNDSIFSTSDLS